MAQLEDRNVLLVVPPSRFKDEELKTTQAFLERQKCKPKIACSESRASFGMGGMRARPDFLIDDVNVDDYDAVIFIGGMGARDYWDHPGAQGLARKAMESDKIVGATSTAPVILARAGLLEGRSATVYFSETKQLTERGAKYTGGAVAVDGKLITCKGPEAMEQFALGLVKLLQAPRPT